MSDREPRMRRFLAGESVSLEAEMDEDWCAALREAYREGSHRTVIQSGHFYIEERLSDMPCTYRPRGRGLERVITAAADDDGVAMDGRFHGARLIPRQKVDEDGDIYFEFLPYAIMSDVVTIPGSESEVSHVLTDKSEFLFAPISFEDYSLALYPEIPIP